MPADTELVSSDLMLLERGRTSARFFDFPADRFTDIVLQVRNPREVRKVAEKLSLALPDTRPILREEILRTYDAVFGWRQGLVFVLLAGAMLAFVIFAWDRASGLSGEERREIGILKAIGWETGDVLRMKFWEGAALSPDGLSPRLSARLCPCLSLLRRPVRPRAQGLGRALSRLPARSPSWMGSRSPPCSSSPSSPTPWRPSSPSGGPPSPTPTR